MNINKTNSITNILKFWTDDRGLIFLLISTSLLIFVIYPIAGNSPIASIVTNIFFLIVLISGLLSIEMEKKYKKPLYYFLLVIMVLTLLGHIFENDFITHLHLLSRIFFLWVLIILIFIRVFNSKTISFFYRITGSVTIYLLIGFIWANMYYIFYQINPGAFHFDSSLNPDDNIMFNFIYFSFETLTTLGLGDVLPVQPFLKSFVILEALIGPLYLAVLVGRLVSVRRTNNN